MWFLCLEVPLLRREELSDVGLAARTFELEYYLFVYFNFGSQVLKNDVIKFRFICPVCDS